jgi:hypothetical protein
MFEPIVAGRALVDQGLLPVKRSRFAKADPKLKFADCKSSHSSCTIRRSFAAHMRFEIPKQSRMATRPAPCLHAG